MSPPGRYNGSKCAVPTCHAMPAHERRKCPHHLAQARKHHAARRQRGQCSTCPDPAVEGRTRCAACLEYQRTYDANRAPRRPARAS